MTFQQPDTQLAKRFAWGGTLTVLTVASSLAVACGTPFAALATLAALFLPRRDAFVLFLMSPAGSRSDFAAPVVLYILYVNAVAFVALLLLQAAAAALGFISSMTAFRYGAAVPRGDADDRP